MTFGFSSVCKRLSDLIKFRKLRVVGCLYILRALLSIVLVGTVILFLLAYVLQAVAFFSLPARSGIDKFYLSLLGSLAIMHVIDAVPKSFSNLFRAHRYSPLEKLYSVFFSFIAGLSLRDISERLCLPGASRESVKIKIWVHRFSSSFKPSKRARRLVAVDETVLKVKGLWALIRASAIHLILKE
jgi:hypothetical protein